MAAPVSDPVTRLVPQTVGRKHCKHCERVTLQHTVNFVNGTIRKGTHCDVCHTIELFEPVGDEFQTPTATVRYEAFGCRTCRFETLHAVVEQGKPLDRPRCVRCCGHQDDAIELRDLSRL